MEMENDEDFDDDDYSAQPLTDIQLVCSAMIFSVKRTLDDVIVCGFNLYQGFVRNGVNNLFLDKDWSNWDGGKVGGFPVSIIQYTHCIYECVVYISCILKCVCMCTNIRFGWIRATFRMLRN